MELRTVTDTIPEYPNSQVTFHRRGGTFTLNEAFPEAVTSVTTNGSGAYSVELWPNAEGLSATSYLAVYPGKDTFEFVLEDDPSPITAAELRAQEDWEWTENPPPSLIDLERARYASTVNSSLGSRLIGWLSSATGAVGRWLSDKLSERLSVKDFGAVGDNVTDDLAAFVAMNAYAASRYDGSGIRETFIIPAGKYHLSGVCQLTAPAIYLAYGAVLDNTVWYADEQTDLYGLYVVGARYNGFVMHRGQYGSLHGCGALNCGGFGLVAGGYHRSQIALGKIDMFTSKGNAGGYSVSTGIGGLHCIDIPGDAYSPGSITSAGSGYTNGTWVAPATGGTGVRAILAFTISGGVVTHCQPIHGGQGYTAGDVLSFSNAAARNSSGTAILAGSGFTYTVGNVQDRRTWNNAMQIERLIVRLNWRYAVQMDGANSYDTWITPQIEGNKTRDIPLIQGTALALTIIGPHIAGVRAFSPVPSLIPTSLTRVTTTATITTPDPHGLAVDDFILISAAIPFAGLQRILTVPTATTATFEVSDTGETEIEVDPDEPDAPTALWIEAEADTDGATVLIDLESANTDGRSMTIIGGRIGNQFSTSLAPRADLLKLDESAYVPNTEVFSHEATDFGNTARTFTPTLSFVTNGNTNVVYTTRVGKYIELPGAVQVSIELEATITHTTASGTLQITGLPFAAAATPSRQALTLGRIDNLDIGTSNAGLVATVVANNATIFFYQNRDATTSNAIDTLEVPSGATYRFEVSGWYLT